MLGLWAVRRSIDTVEENITCGLFYVLFLPTFNMHSWQSTLTTRVGGDIVPACSIGGGAAFEAFGGGGVEVSDVFDDISTEQAADAADDDFLN